MCNRGWGGDISCLKRRPAQDQDKAQAHKSSPVEIEERLRWVEASIKDREKEGGEGQMERAREALRVGEEEDEAVERMRALSVRAHRAGEEGSFYEGFALRGIHVDQIQPGFLCCSFTVPPRLTDVNGEMAAGAIANLVDEVGGAALTSQEKARPIPIKVSVDMNIAFLSPANLGDELEIRSRVLGHKGGYSGTHVLLRNKTTGQVIAEGRHSLFGNLKSKI